MTQNQHNKIPKEELLEDLKKTEEKVEGKLTIQKYKKHGKHSPWPIQARFPSWNEAKEEAGLATVEHGHGARIPNEKLIEDLQKLAEQKDSRITIPYYEEHGKYSNVTLRERFGTWNKAKEEAGLATLDRGETTVTTKDVEAVEEKLSDMQGRMRVKEFRKLIKDRELSKIHVPLIIEELNERDNGYTITQSTNGGHGAKVFIDNDSIGLYDKYYEILPEGTAQVLEAIMSSGSGRSPATVTAAIKYIYDEEATQREVSDEVGVSEVSLRNAYHVLEEKGFDEIIKEARN